MTPQEELYTKFFNHEGILVKDMDLIQLREHREELSKIAFEAKARLVRTDDELRERTAKSKVGKEWLTSITTDQVTSDAINVVKVRKERMNSIEKARLSFEKAGLDKETIDIMIKNMERNAINKDLKTITFTKPSVKITAVQVSVNKPSEPFDPSSLFNKDN